MIGDIDTRTGNWWWCILGCDESQLNIERVIHLFTRFCIPRKMCGGRYWESARKSVAKEAAERQGVTSAWCKQDKAEGGRSGWRCCLKWECKGTGLVVKFECRHHTQAVWRQGRSSPVESQSQPRKCFLKRTSFSGDPKREREWAAASGRTVLDHRLHTRPRSQGKRRPWFSFYGSNTEQTYIPYWISIITGFPTTMPMLGSRSTRDMWAA